MHRLIWSLSCSLITPPMNRLFALFLSLCRNSTHLFHLPLHHDTSPLFLPGPGLHVRRHRPSSLLCSTYWRRIFTRTSRLESRSYVIARSTRKPSRNDNNIASPWFEYCLLGWLRHESTPRFTPLLSLILGWIRPYNGRTDVVQRAAATRLRRGKIFILLQPRPSHWSANESHWVTIKTEEMFKMYVCSKWSCCCSQIQHESSFRILTDYFLFGK